MVSGINATLEINDSSGDGLIELAEDVTFFANYTNSSNGAAINGATCNISINGAAAIAMGDFDGALYNYTTSFVTGGTKNYNISCFKTGFDLLVTNETLIVNLNVIPEFSDYAMMIVILGSLCIGGYIRRKELN